MKIAFLSINNGLVDRGAETFVIELASRLSKNHKVDVYQAGKVEGNENYNVIHIPVNVDTKRVGENNFLTSRLFIDYTSRVIFLFAAKAFSSLISKKYDVVIPVNGGWLTILTRLATWVSGAKMVVSGQSGIGWDDRINILCFPNAFVGVSTKAFLWAKKTNPFTKTVYIPNGVDLTKFKPSGRKYKHSLKSPVIITVAALVPTKRISLVMHAVKKIKNASLLVVGSGGLYKELNSLGNKLLGDRFKIAEVRFSDMPTVYRSADAFVFVPEAAESFGIVYVEAMASGLPVVGIDDSIRREIIGKAGVLVKNPEKSSELAKSVEKALRSSFGKVSRVQSANFDWGKIAKDYEKLFKDLVV